MRRLLIILFLIGYFFSPVFAQGELNEQQKIFFRNERSFAFLLNSDGYGVSYREARRIDFLNKRFFEIETGNLKHPREYRQSNPLYQTPGTFKYGKINGAIYLRGSIGRQHELFTKADLGGVAVRFFYSGGPTLAFYKPVYYKILYPISAYEYQLKEEKLDVDKHPAYDIYSKAPWVKGLGETHILPGLFIKTGVNFEYSKEEKVIHAVEAGFTFSGFLKEIPIMATADNQALFFSLFISYRFGVVIDPLNPETNKFSYIFKRKKAAPSY